MGKRLVSRREVMSAAAGMAVSAGSRPLAFAQNPGPVRIGLVYSKQGPG